MFSGGREILKRFMESALYEDSGQDKEVGKNSFSDG